MGPSRWLGVTSRDKLVASSGSALRGLLALVLQESSQALMGPPRVESPNGAPGDLVAKSEMSSQAVSEDCPGASKEGVSAAELIVPVEDVYPEEGWKAVTLTKGRKAILILYALVALFLCTIAVPWVHYFPGTEKKLVQGSGYAPIWSPTLVVEWSGEDEIGPDMLENFISLSLEERASFLAGSRQEVQKIYKRFQNLPPEEQRSIIADFRKTRRAYVVARTLKGQFERYIDTRRLLVELLGLTIVAGAAFAFFGPKEQ